MLFSYSLAALSVATSFVTARPLPHYQYRRQAITDFGTCNATPDVIFALGLDGRKDPAFQAKNNDVFNHGSALGIGVITSFICQQLNDRCKAPQATLTACTSGQAAAAKATGGAAADAFNNAFGIVTTFASSGASSGAGASAGASTSSSVSEAAAATSTTVAAATGTSTSTAAGSASTCATASTVTVTAEATATASTPCPTDPVTVTITGTGTGVATTSAAETTSATSAAETSAVTSNVAVVTSASTSAAPAATAPASSLDFGSCTNPTIEFGPAFEGRKAAEFSNKPVNKEEFAQASALNVNIVTRAICDILANKCKAPQATLDACTKGQAAASAATAKTGAQADAFNAALGFTTNFTNIPAAPGGGPGTEALATTPNFGTCTNPTMEFGVGFDGRTEASFQPANKASFNHGSALNPQIIATSICDTLVNSCNANKPAIDNCAAAKAAIAGLTGQAVVDAFNSAVVKGAA